MRTKLIPVIGLAFVVIFASAFFRTPPPTVPGLTRPTIDDSVFAGEPAGAVRPHMLADEGEGDEVDTGDEGGGFLSHLRGKNPAAANKRFTPNRAKADNPSAKPRVVRPRNRVAPGAGAGVSRLRPSMREDATDRRLTKRRDLLAKRRAEREQGAGDLANTEMADDELAKAAIEEDEAMHGDEAGDLPPLDVDQDMGGEELPPDAVE